MLSDEDQLPYDLPPLSKAYSLGKAGTTPRRTGRA
jgi:hypothetical protein